MLDIRFKILFILYFLSLSIQAFEVHLEVGKWEFKEKYGLFKLREKVLKKCERPRSSFGVITFYDCPFVVIQSENNLKVYHNQLVENLFGEIEYKIILKVPKENSESFFGIGTQFSHFRLNGKKFEILSQEQGNGRGKQPLTFFQRIVRPGLEGSATSTYAASPIVYSSNLKSFVFDSYVYGEADFSDDKYNEFSFITSDLTFYQEKAGSWKELIEKTTRHTGRMRALPEWIQEGAIVGLMGGKESVAKRLEKIKSAGTPLAGVWLQDWVGQRQTQIGPRLIWDWQRDHNLYSDLDFGDTPVLGYFNPFLSPLPVDNRISLLKEALEKDYLVKVHGEPHGTDNGGFDGYLVDLFNPEARTWLKDIIIKQVRDNKFKGWMADFSEAMPFDAETLAPKSEQHHRYIEEWIKLNREVVNEVDSKELTFFNRASYLRGPGYSTLNWLGDQLSSWDKKDGMHSSLVGLLTGGLSGQTLNHSDIGGYVSACFKPFVCIKRTEELLIRWMELNAFGLVFRTHVGLKPSIAHQVDSSEKSLKAFARWAKTFKVLKEYKKPFLEEAASKGIPVVRPIFLEFPADKNTYSIDSQFMLGDSLMMAPMLKSKKSRRVYLPQGKWFSVYSEEIWFSKGETFKVEAPLGKPAVFVKESFPEETFTQLREL